jgi:hypothetical protein
MTYTYNSILEVEIGKTEVSLGKKVNEILFKLTSHGGPCHPRGIEV